MEALVMVMLGSSLTRPLVIFWPWKFGK